MMIKIVESSLRMGIVAHHGDFVLGGLIQVKNGRGRN